MSFPGGWLGPAFQVLNAQRAGAEQGKAQGDVIAYERKKDEEERQRQLQSDALRNQLLKLQIQHANDPGEWHPTTQAESVQYFQATHPQQQQSIDPLSDQGISAALRRRRGEASIDAQNPSGGVNWENVQQPDGSVVQVNPRSGATRPVSFQGKPLVKGSPAGDKAPTEGERRASALLVTARDAFPVLQAAEPPSFVENSLSKVGPGNAALSAGRQKALQAGAQFYRSYLYIVSGATVNPQEAEEAAKTFTPQFGDKPETIAQKRHAQQTMLQAMEQAAGRAVTPASEPTMPTSDPIGRAYSHDNPFAPSE